VLAVVDEEVGLGALRQRVLARVRVRRPLRHRPSLSAAAGIKRRAAFKARPLGGRGGTQAEAVEMGRPLRLEVGSEPSPPGMERSGGASRERGGGGKRGGEVDWWTMRKRALNRRTG
jgi:hypothetical protein